MLVVAVAAAVAFAHLLVRSVLVVVVALVALCVLAVESLSSWLLLLLLSLLLSLLHRKMGFPRLTLPFSYVKEARAKTGSVFLCPFSYFWWVLHSSGSGFSCQFSYTLVKKGSNFCEVFAEGSLPERHTLVLIKGKFSVRCLPKAACRSVTPWF